MLFLTNIPTGRKVILRALLDSENAAIMEDPLLKYTCPEIYTDEENREISEMIFNKYFAHLIVAVWKDSDIVKLFSHWSLKHFHSIYEKMRFINNDIGRVFRNSFWTLVIQPYFSTKNLVDYFIELGVEIPDDLYYIALYTENESFFKWLDNRKSIFEKKSCSEMITYCLVIHYKPHLYRYLFEKYGGNAEYVEILKERLRKCQRLIHDNNMVGFINLIQQWNVA
jgi:hypothetical protein